MNDLPVLISAPIGRDAELLAQVLRDAGITAVIVAGPLSALDTERRDAAGALLVAEEALTSEIIESLVILLSSQAKWSDLPFLVMASVGREAAAIAAEQRERLLLGHLTILERPLRRASLLSAVQAALRARRRQFEIRDMTRSLTDAYAELRMSEQQARLILQSTHDCIKLLDLDGNVLSINEEGQKRLGITDLGTVCGTSWLGFWTSVDAENARKAVDSALAGKVGSFEGFFRTAAGEATWWDISVTAVRSETGEIVNLLAMSREITHKKITEQALIQSEKLAAVGRMVSTISHEINNPLESVTNLIYIAMHTEGLPAEAMETLVTADEELRRASQIVAHTLKFHRQSTGPVQTTPEKLVSSVVNLYRGRLANSQIKVESEHDPDVSLVCLEGELRQVLNNLIGNAIDAMRGGGRLLVRSHTATNARTEKQSVVITVADTGHGMDAEVARRAFEAFYTTKGDNGTGLGLWITKGIVEKHCGHLTMRSRSGLKSGTVFRLMLPAAQ